MKQVYFIGINKQHYVKCPLIVWTIIEHHFMLKRPYLLKYYLPAYGQRSPAVLRKQPKQSYTQWGKPSHTRRSNPNLQGLGGGG